MQQDNFYKYALTISGLTLGLGFYNMMAQRKNRAVLERNELMGGDLYKQGCDSYNQLGLLDDVESVPEIKLQDDGTTLDTVSNVADQYFSTVHSKVDSLLQNPQVKEQLAKLGVTVNVNSLNKERLKNVMAGYGLFMLIMFTKNNLQKVAIAGAGFVLLTKNQDKIQMALNAVIGDKENIV